MFTSKRKSTVIAEGLKIVGSVTAVALIEVNGEINGELRCKSLVINRKGLVTGPIVAERVLVEGRVDGPIRAGQVVLKAQAHVVGDIYCRSLVVENGAFMEGRLARTSDPEGATPEATRLFGRGAVYNGPDELAAAEAEASTRYAELMVEGRHLSGNPDLLPEEVLFFLAMHNAAGLDEPPGPKVEDHNEKIGPHARADSGDRNRSPKDQRRGS